MKKQNILIIVGLLLAIGMFYGGRSVYYEFYPIEVYPSESWEPFVSSLDAQREAFFIEVDGINLEAELFIPNGGAEQKPAVFFRPVPLMRCTRTMALALLRPVFWICSYRAIWLSC